MKQENSKKNDNRREKSGELLENLVALPGQLSQKTHE